MQDTFSETMAQGKESLHVEIIREVFVYASRYQGKLFVFKIDNSIIDHPYFGVLIKDLVMLHNLGIRIVIIPGSTQRIDTVLGKYGIVCEKERGIRISTAEAMPFIKMAAFDVANEVMTRLAGNNTNAIIGNWVRARSIGVQEGVDFKFSGTVDKIKTDLLRNVLTGDHIPILPSVGWNLLGQPYNISSNELACVLSAELKAEKLFFLSDFPGIEKAKYENTGEYDSTPEGLIPRLNIDEVTSFLKDNGARNDPAVEFLNLALRACSGGVNRVHILDGRVEGVILQEIFTNLGSGVMIYANQYANIRQMKHEDISDVLRIMRPYMAKGILVPRNEAQLEATCGDYIVYEIDNTIQGCGSLLQYADNQAEIAGIAVSDEFKDMGIGQKIVTYLLEKAKKQNIAQVFLLTTRTSDWFEKLGFRTGQISDLPEEKRNHYNTARNSRILVYTR